MLVNRNGEGNENGDVCPTCQKVVKGKQGRRHIRFCRRVECGKCKKTFMSLDLLKRHFMSHTNVFKCEVCQKVLSSKQGLDRHGRIHSGGQEKLPCDICRNVFSTKSSLNRHMKKFHQYHSCTSCRLSVPPLQKLKGTVGI